MIHVCYGIHDRDGRYSKFAATSMVSIFENVTGARPSVTVHILHDNTMTFANWQNFIYLAGSYGQRVEFHNVEQLCADKLQFLQEKLATYMQSRFSIGAFYRLLIKDIGLRDVSKIIYLDSDTIINLDLHELWNQQMGDYCLAAVPEIQATRGYMITDKYILHSKIVDLADYLCSGVAILSLDNLSDDFFEEGVLWLSEHLQCECPDQDILNNFFSKSYLKLPEKFDAFVGVCRMLDGVLLPKIYHFAGNCLGMNMNDAFDRLFFMHFTKTPWFGLDTIQHAYEAMSRIYIERQNFAIGLARLMPGKERAFVISPANVDAVKTIFAVKDTEEFILSNSADAFQRVVSSMNESRGRKVFFILIDNFAEVHAALANLGFVWGEDYLDATAFLHDEHGVPLRAFALVKLL